MYVEIGSGNGEVVVEVGGEGVCDFWFVGVCVLCLNYFVRNEC